MLAGNTGATRASGQDARSLLPVVARNVAPISREVNPFGSFNDFPVGSLQAVEDEADAVVGPHPLMSPAPADLPRQVERTGAS